MLSGGIGAGKSTVAEMLAGQGVAVIHADKIGHAVLEPEGEAFGAVSAWWPEVVIDGRIDRSQLAAIVFADPRALDQLESMTHPAIVARILNLEAAHSADDLVVVELPLLLPLLGPGWTRVVVDASLATRRRRLAERGMALADIDARMAAQPAPAEWRAAADYTVHNDGTLEDLGREVDQLLEWLETG